MEGRRVKAGFLDGITNIVPALGGVNIKELLNEAADEMGGKVLLDFNDTMVIGFKFFWSKSNAVLPV
ncbi:unnamed protein product [Prunus armeniaca]|uniref:Uncharacterized protein n=1 Tax=Prunus armeniaca TaxID=36596 RepID=A0A6J5UFY7_PRUAR|nr:unnamed protein product [Prunus armeniaca]